MSKTKWDGAEDPKINNFYRIDNRDFKYVLKIADRPKPTAVFHIIVIFVVMLLYHLLAYLICNDNTYTRQEI